MTTHLVRATPSRRRTARQIGVLAVAAAVVTGLAMQAPATASTPRPASATATPTHPVRHVSARLPLIGPSRSFGAVRPAGVTAPTAGSLTALGPAVNTWSTLSSMPGAVVHDIAFPTAKVGYAAAELGQVWKTTDGGTTWTRILNRGFPFYYYGVAAVNRKTLVVSGFNDSTSEGIISWSHDGGATWAPDQVLSPSGWVGRIRIPGSPAKALAMNGGGSSGTDPNLAWYSTTKTDWHQVVPDPAGGWFGNQFTLLPNGHAMASGITYCDSQTGGADWSCGPAVDQVFDGPTAFVDDQHGWVGGGEISPDVAGWLHRTTNGGATWSGRVLETAWPIRQIEFLNKRVGWATGGDVYSGVGGISFTTDGGKTWSLDSDTGDEVGACAHHATGTGARTRVWCVGFSFDGSQFTSTVYRTSVDTP